MFYGHAKQTMELYLRVFGFFAIVKCVGDHCKSSLLAVEQEERKPKKCCSSIHIYIICFSSVSPFVRKIWNPTFTTRVVQTIYCCAKSLKMH